MPMGNLLFALAVVLSLTGVSLVFFLSSCYGQKQQIVSVYTGCVLLDSNINLPISKTIQWTGVIAVRTEVCGGSEGPCSCGGNNTNKHTHMHMQTQICTHVRMTSTRTLTR
jgi:hypothetical protein